MNRIIDHKELYKSFSRNSFFENFQEKEFEEFASLGNVRNFEKNQFIFEKDMKSDAMYLLVDGLVKIVSFSEDGKEALLNRVYPGEILGEIGIMDGGTRTAAAYCAEPSTLIAVPRQEFFRFLEENPRFYKTVISQLCNYLRWSTEVIEDVLFSSRYQKLARKLLHIKSKQDNGGNTIKVSQEELGNMLGLSREIINKSLQDLQNKNLIVLKRAQIEILNEDGLREIIEGEAM